MDGQFQSTHNKEDSIESATITTRGVGACVTHCGLATYIKKKCLLLSQLKEELWKLKIFSPCKNIIFKKKKIL
jgi:hypothetical protein